MEYERCPKCKQVKDQSEWERYLEQICDDCWEAQSDNDEKEKPKKKGNDK